MDELDRVLLGLLASTSSSRASVLDFVAHRLRTLPDPAGLDGDPPVSAGRDALVSAGRDALVSAWRGWEGETRSLATGLLRDGSPESRTAAHHALTILELGLGRYDAALGHALAVRRCGPPPLREQIVPDLLEAATRSSHPGAVPTAARGVDVGVLSPLCRALLSYGDVDDLYRQALDELRHVSLARAHLLYGEWLRRRRRRRDARDHLRTAGDMFASMNAVAFARRAAVELGATAETVGERDGLTAQEAEVARLVAEGHSNREVAEQLFLSQNTVQYHLAKVYRKLGVRSRTQLVRVLLTPAGTP
ncbi:helix-turn-helix transcriptional regulator [Paractinoplanes deccanensis]|nr:helix-turn-helix transcriptional regulator [Actinoplanes deccanensis]